jgi:uncharacterized protein
VHEVVECLGWRVCPRVLSNLKAQLTKAEGHVAASSSGEAAVLNARLAVEGRHVG